MDWHSYLDSASRKLKTADHLLTMTYPIVGDTKLLKTVMKDIIEAVFDAVKCMMAFRRQPIKTELDMKEYKELLSCFGISTGYSDYLIELSDIRLKQRTAGVEFIRKEKFVFASDDYDITFITEQHLKEMMAKARLFVKEVSGVVK